MKRNNHSLLGTTILVAGITIVSKLLGFAREAIIASNFGADANTDAFFFAHSMPEMVFPSVCNSISTAFVSIYVYELNKDKIRGNQYATRALSTSLLLGLLLSILGIVLSPLLVRLLAPGFTAAQIVLATRLTQITMSAFILIMAQYMINAILNSNRIFTMTQVVGLSYNLVVIFITVLAGKNQSMDFLAVTIIIGQSIHLVGSFALLKIFHVQLYKPRLLSKDECKYLARMVGPILIGNAAIQISTITDKVLGSLLEAGSVSALSYSHTLCNIVTGVFITSLSTVIYPTLSKYAAERNMEKLADNTQKCIISLATILIPISVIFITNSGDIVSFVYGRGNFDDNAVRLTSSALAFYSPMFMFYGIREIISRVFFSVKDTKTPMINTCIGVGVNVFFSIVLSKVIGIGGIALGTSLSSLITVVLLLVKINKRFAEFKIINVINGIVKQLISGALMLMMLYVIENVINIDDFLGLLTNTIAGCVIYLILTFIINRDAVLEIKSLTKKKYAEKEL